MRALLEQNERNQAIARVSRFDRRPPVKDGPRSNRDIIARQVRLIDQRGDNHGVMDTRAALDLATNVGLDLVEISSDGATPVAKIMDLGRYKYQKQKKAAEAKKKQKVVETKEVKLRPNIDTHDYDTKMRSANKFLENGDKVKFTMRFRGREMAHQNLGLDVLMRIQEDLGDTVRIDAEPKLEGRQMMMVVSPKSS